jgi:hypothetical protein
VWGLLVGLATFSDNSFMTHLATGRILWAGEFPREDVYSFTAPGTRWVVQSWLASVAFAGAERLGGTNAIHVVTGALTASLGVIIWVLTRPADTLFSRLLAAGASIYVAGFFWSERPLLFGLVGLGMVLLALERHIPAVALLPVMWLWVNAHGSYPLAVVATIAFAAGRRLDGEHPSHELRVLAFVVGGILLGGLGPLGLEVFRFPIALLGRSDILSYIVEWQSPSFDERWTRAFLVLLLAAIVALVRRPSFRATVPFAVFLGLALVSMRNIAPAVLVWLPGLAAGAAGLGALRGDRRSRSFLVATAMVSVVGLVATVGRLGGPAWTFDSYPVRALAYAHERGLLASTDVRVATQDEVGNLLEGMFGADAQAFFDDRVDMYPRSVVEDYVTLVEGGPGWEQVLERHDIAAIVWPSDTPLASLVREDADWHVEYQDQDDLVACRRGSAACR